MLLALFVTVPWRTVGAGGVGLSTKGEIDRPHKRSSSGMC